MAIKTGLFLNRSRQVPAEDTPAFGGIAERFRRAGDLDRAITLCREGLRKFPALLSARVTLGWALLDKGEYKEARAELEQVLRRAPDNLAAIRGLAELHERTGHLQSTHHDVEQDIDLERLTAAIAEEERVAAEGSRLDSAANQFAAATSGEPQALSFEVEAGPESSSDAEPFEDSSLTTFEVPGSLLDPELPAAAAEAAPAAFEFTAGELTSTSDFLAQSSTAATDFYASEPVELASASEVALSREVETPVTDAADTPAVAAFAIDEPALPAPADTFDLVVESQGLDPVVEPVQPGTLSLGPLRQESAPLAFDATHIARDDVYGNASAAADDVVTLPSGGELEFDDLSLAIGAFGLEAASIERKATDPVLDEHGRDRVAAPEVTAPAPVKPAFDDIAPIAHGTLAGPEMAGVFDHDFGLAAERAEESHDYDLPDGDPGWMPERDAHLAAFSSLTDGFNARSNEFHERSDRFHETSDGLSGEVEGFDQEIRDLMPDGKVLAMAARTPIPKFSTAGLERLLRQVEARRVALAASPMA